MLHIASSMIWSRYYIGSKVELNCKLCIYIYLLFIKHHPFPPLQGWHTSCHEMTNTRREVKLKKRKKKKRKINPFRPFKKQAWPSTELPPKRASYNCCNKQLVKIKGSSPRLSPMHSSSQTPTIHFYPAQFSLLTWDTNLFFLNIPSWHQSIFSLAYPLSDNQHTLLHRLS